LGVGLGVGFVTTGGTTTGGTTTGGTTTVTGGTVTGGTVTGGTVTGGTVTGVTLTGSGTPIVTMTGFDGVVGFVVPVPDDCGDPDGGVLATVTAAGVGVAVGLVDVPVVGAGLTDGVGVLVAECCLGTTISGLPPPVCGVEPK